MKAKWYIGTLLIILSVLGLSQHKTVLPNQEIVLNFADKNITSSQAQDVIVLIKNRLRVLGAQSIKVQALKLGKLHISYFSTTKANSIKGLLLEHNHLETAYKLLASKNTPDTPYNKADTHFKLDVFEIQKKSGKVGFGGKYVLQYKQDLDRFNKPNDYSFQKYRSIVSYKVHEVAPHTTYCCHTTTQDNNLLHVQEVRAGPLG